MGEKQDPAAATAAQLCSIPPVAVGEGEIRAGGQECVGRAHVEAARGVERGRRRRPDVRPKSDCRGEEGRGRCDGIVFVCTAQECSLLLLQSM